MPKDTQGGTPDAGADKTAKKGPGGIILVVISVVLVGLGIGVGIFMGQRSRVAVLQEPQKPGQMIIYPLSDLFVNIAETKATRVLKLTPALSLSDEKMKAEIDKYRPVLRDQISQIASRMTIDDLEGRNGRDMLKREIKNSVNIFLREHTTGAVVDVFFSDFLIQ